MKPFWLLALLLLVACGPQEAAPTPSPTTPPFLQNYQGPLMGGLSLEEADSSACSVDSGCSVSVQGTVVALDPAPRPLTPQTVGAFRIGIPEGYAPLILKDEILITATGLETPGGFVFSIHHPDDLTPLLKRFGNPNFEEGKPLATGRWLSVPDGALALLQLPNSPPILIEASTDSGYWAAFEATFLAMIAALSPS